MKKLLWTIFSLLGIAMITMANAAEDDPQEILQAASEANSVQAPAQQTLEQRWQEFVQASGWGNNTFQGGVIYVQERQIVASSAVVFPSVAIGQPGWIESRVAAFERAEMEAKVKVVRFLAEEAESSRSLDMLENAAWSDGTVEEVKQLGEVSKILNRLGKKSLALGDAALDSALRKLDPEYDPADYESMAQEEVKIIVEDKFKRKLRNMAHRTSIGIASVHTVEGNFDGEYKVLVGVVWSPKLNRLAMSLFNNEYSIPPVKPGAKIEDQVPNHSVDLIGMVGSRIVIDENGEFCVMAYAQAQPRMSAPTRVQAALQRARQVAAERARGQIVNFVREGLTFRSSEESEELFREFSDQTAGTATYREIQRRIAGKKTKVKLRGLRVVREWSERHPETGQMVAGAVVAWSPAGSRISQIMEGTMSTRPASIDRKNEIKKAEEGAESVPEGHRVIESMPIDTSAY